MSSVAQMQTQQLRAMGHEPVTCGACGWPGHVVEEGVHGFLVRHVGRAFPCRTESAEPIPKSAADVLEDPA